MSRSVAVVGWFAFLAPITWAADVTFVDVTAVRGLGPFMNEEGHGSGAAAADYDADGDVDVFIPQAAGLPDLLYQNDGTGHFVEVAGSVGLARMTSSRTALWFDYDGDHVLDLVVSNDDQDAATSFHLYRQIPGTGFEDVTTAAGLHKEPIVEVPLHTMGGMCAGDINNDGYLDLFSGQWRGPGHLFLNDGSGTFIDISESSGIAAVHTFQHQAIMADFNADGWLDIYVAVDFEHNLLWINQRDNTFIDEAAGAGIDNNMNDMGLALGDYDNDGDLDIYVTNIFDERLSKHSVLFRNDSVGPDLSFIEVSASMGVDDGRYGWGATFFDADRDGDVDLAATNGWRSGETQGWPTDPSRFFVNAAAGMAPFVEEAQAAGLDDTEWGSALIAADFDRDGDQDVLQVCLESISTASSLRLLDSSPLAPGSAPGYLVVQPRSSGPNHLAIGATVTVEAAGMTMTRLISAGTSYMGQEPAEAFFGLARALSAETVTITWPNGDVTVLEDVPGNQVIKVFDTCTLGACADSNADGIRDDNCTWWTCAGDLCTATEIVFGDMSGQFGSCEPDGAADGNDRFQALNCFAAQGPDGGPYTCEAAPPLAYNVDAGGQFGTCAPDGVCDGNDAFHALNAFAGATDCSCPLDGGPMPDPVDPVVVDQTSIALIPSTSIIRPNETVLVDIFVNEALDDLRGYQLHLNVSGGLSGGLETIDISVQPRETRAFVSDWRAFNLTTRQIVAGLDGDGSAVPLNAYLATFTLKASSNASGSFAVELLHDDGDPSQRTFLFPTAQRGMIKVIESDVVQVTVR